LLFFSLWPVKGFQYLLPIAPVAAVLAARTVVRPSLPAVVRRLHPRASVVARGAVLALICLSLAVPSWLRINPAPTTTFLAGSGGLPGGREAGWWIDANLPEGATILTIGPSMANLVQFYGHRRAFGLSVSPNPLNRNPSYLPVDNPDRQLRRGDLQYIVWDSYSAARAPNFSTRLLAYARKYKSDVIHTVRVPVRGRNGLEQKPVITVYEVQPR
jgi:hypothetical protein